MKGPVEKNDLWVQEIAVAALYHDIGKLLQRAGFPKPSTIDLFCPQFQHRRSHLHSAYTHDFLVNSCALPDYFNRERVAVLAASHHIDPRNDTAKAIIKEADHISAAMDRIKEEDPVVREEQYLFRKTRLKSVWPSISIADDKHERTDSSARHYPLAPLSQAEALYPSPADAFEQFGHLDLAEEFAALYGSLLKRHKAFSEVIGKNLHMPFHHYFSWALSVLEEYTWSVPSSTYRDVPDISLFDHSTTTAAIATALAAYHGDSGTLSSITDAETAKFLLVQADLAGIQHFIFDFSPKGGKGVAKLLRGRSHYVSLMLKALSLLVIQKLGLCPSNIISFAGGKFTILAPNTEAAKEKLHALKTDVENSLWQDFSGELTINIDFTVEATAVELATTAFNGLQERMAKAHAAVKARKFSSLLTGRSGTLPPESFVHKQDFTSGACHLTGKGPALSALVENDPLSGLSSVTLDQVLLGKELTRAVGYAWSMGGAGRFSFFNRAVSLDTIREFSSPGQDCIMIEALDGNPLYTGASGPGYVARVGEIAAAVGPLEATADIHESDRVANFNELAGTSTGSNKVGEPVGLPLLGVLKADVDNLGLIFRKGLQTLEHDQYNGSLSRYVFMSRTLDRFFTKIIPGLLNKKRKKDSKSWAVYTVYAGGDDFLMVGAYTHIYEFATEILQPEFEKFTGANPEITISAGIGFFSKKSPIWGMVAKADNELDSAKHSGKNRLGLLGETVPWARCGEINDWKEFFDSRAKSARSAGGKISLSTIYRILKYQRMAIKALNDSPEGKNPRWFLWNSLFTYDLTRNLYPGDKAPEEELQDFDRLNQLRNMMAADKEFLKALVIPLTLASYQNRRR